MEASLWVQVGVAATAIYLFVIGGVMQLFPTLGLKKE
jgi:phosphatidylcholine synthase